MEIFALYVSSFTFALFFPYSRTSLCTLPCERDLVSYLLAEFKQGSTSNTKMDCVFVNRYVHSQDSCEYEHMPPYTVYIYVNVFIQSTHRLHTPNSLWCYCLSDS